MHVIWITAGLGCDGDTIAMTAATNPSIEDLVLGALPGIPMVRLPNPVLAYEVGDDFIGIMRRAAAGDLSPFILVVEGSIPNENNKAEGYWAAIGTDPATGQPISTCEWIDRLAPGEWAVVGAGTCATYGGIHAMAGNPTGCMGLPDYLGWTWKSSADIPIVCMPGCPIQPDNFMETLLYLLRQAVGRAPMIPLDELLRPAWLFGETVHEGYYRARADRPRPAGRGRRGANSGDERASSDYRPGAGSARGGRGLAPPRASTDQLVGQRSQVQPGERADRGRRRSNVRWLRRNLGGRPRAG